MEAIFGLLGGGKKMTLGEENSRNFLRKNQNIRGEFWICSPEN